VITLEPWRTPSACHAALDAGCHVLYEKPGGTSVEDLTALAQKARAREQQFVAAFSQRVRPNIRYARQLVRDGLLGDIWAVNAVFVARDRLLRGWQDYGGGWLFSKERGGGGWLTFLGCHSVDAIRYVTAQEFASVSGFSGVVHDEPIEVDDANALAFRLGGGGFGTLLTGYVQPEHPGLRSMTVYGSDGWVCPESHESELRVQCFSRKAGSRAGRHWTVTFEPPAPELEPYPMLLAEFIDAIHGKCNSPVEPEAGARMLEFAYAAYRASETGEAHAIDRA
jgi:predicted dehydrogenase